MKIIWNKVTHLSMFAAIILFVAVLFVGYQLGRFSQTFSILGNPTARANFVCSNGKTIEARFYDRFVHLEFPGHGNLYLPQTISASGARYANSDESIVFWNKGGTAFITEGGANNLTYKDCVIPK